MTKEEYLDGWMQVIDEIDIDTALTLVSHFYKTGVVCPKQQEVFKAFKICPYDNLRVVCLLQDPYPQPGVATGIALGNSADTPEEKISPSLKVVKEAVIDYTIPHNNIIFDNTLESWCRQGVLMLNTALTVEANKIGSHVGIWKPVIKSLLRNLSQKKTGIVYILFGARAYDFAPYINEKTNHILTVDHPAYFARTYRKMPNVFKKANDILVAMNGSGIEWYEQKG